MHIRRWALLTGGVATVAALAAAGAEVTLRLAERGAPDYGDTWRSGGIGPGGWLASSLDLRVVDGTGGRVSWRTDASGFRASGEIAPVPPPGTVRVLSLGDSFAAGYRVDQDDTYSARLERWLQEQGLRVEVPVAVTEGPAAAVYYLREHGLGWRPDLVLLGLTLGNDIAQAYATVGPHGSFRLGQGAEGPTIERLALTPERREWLAAQRELVLPDRCLTEARPSGPPPTRDPWRFLRLVVGPDERPWPQTVTSVWGRYREPRVFDANGIGMHLAEPTPEVGQAYDRLDEVLVSLRDLCRHHGIGLLVALFPQRYCVQPGDWTATIDGYGLRPGCFDLAAPQRRIRDACRRLGISLVDTGPALSAEHRESGRSCYLPNHDMHWNPRGHQAAFSALRGRVASMVSEVARLPRRSPPRGGMDPDPARPSHRKGLGQRAVVPGST